MKKILFAGVLPAVVLVFNYLLYNCFSYGEWSNGELGIGATIIVLNFILLVVTLPLTIWHIRRVINGKPNTVFLICNVTGLLIFSYILFPTNYTPVKVIAEMISVKINKSKLTLNDYFLINNYHVYDNLNEIKISI